MDGMARHESVNGAITAAGLAYQRRLYRTYRRRYDCCCLQTLLTASECSTMGAAMYLGLPNLSKNVRGLQPSLLWRTTYAPSCGCTAGSAIAPQELGADDDLPRPRDAACPRIRDDDAIAVLQLLKASTPAADESIAAIATTIAPLGGLAVGRATALL